MALYDWVTLLLGDQKCHYIKSELYIQYGFMTNGRTQAMFSQEYCFL